MDRVEPNPPSPYATAHPDYRHVIPGVYLTTPMPGVLAPTACGHLAVVPEHVTDTRTCDVLPDGVCPACILVINGDTTNQAAPPPARPCTECGAQTLHDDLCAMCRMDQHDAWRDQQTATGPAHADAAE